jgi:hypothetical protein
MAFAAIAFALAITPNISAQDKAPDRPPDAEKVRARDPRPEDYRSRREGDPRPEAGKAPDGPRPMPRGGQGGFRDGGSGGVRGGGGGFGGGFRPDGMPAGPFGGGMMMPGMGGFGGGYGSFEPDDPEMRDLVRKDSEMDRQTMDLAAKFRQSSGEDRDKLKTQIADLVAKHFDVRQERRKLQLKRMEEELKRLREAITKRDGSTDTIVKNRISELLGEPRDLDF